jgi:hypothetical protein
MSGFTINDVDGRLLWSPPYVGQNLDINVKRTTGKLLELRSVRPHLTDEEVEGGVMLRGNDV